MLTRLLRNSLGRYRGLIIAVLVLQVVQTVAMLLLPRVSAELIDRGVLAGDRGVIWREGLLMIALSAIHVTFAIAAVRAGSWVAAGFGRDVRGSLFHHVTGFSAREVGSFGSATLITRITNDVQQVRMLVQMTCTLMLAAPIMAVGGLVFAVREDVQLSAILLVSIPVLVICVGAVISRLIPRFRVMQDRIDRVNKVLREQLTGIRVVRAFVREPHESARFEQVNSQVTEAGLQAGHFQAFFFPIVLVVINGSSIAAVWLAGGRIDSGAMSVGSLIAFLTYLALILQSVMMASFMAAMVPRASICADRIMEVLETPSSVVPPAAPLVPSGTVLELRDVTFQYPGAEAPVLDRISFSVRPGETTAIVGSTGSGKTTLVSLIPRLADATGGALLFGGVDVRDLDPAILWSRTGLVPQRPYLFSGTVASNIRYGKEDATEEEIWEALRVAQAADFVREMPGGLDAVIEQGGTNVSGGQRQRLAIARALVRRPDIYVFDDSFSALDLRTDAMLRAALRPYTADAGVLIVAQRVSTVMDADQIVVLEDGRVVGLGRHDELLETCPTYAEIVESQGVAREGAR